MTTPIGRGILPTGVFVREKSEVTETWNPVVPGVADPENG